MIAGGGLSKSVFGSPVLQGKVFQLLAESDREPIRQVIHILRRSIEQRKDFSPEGHLNLGVAYAALGDHDNSIAALERAIDQQGEQGYPEAHYYLGRVLFESERDLARAVSELRRATVRDPDYVPAYYYLGQAIRVLVERETLAEAENALQIYLDAGAPLGHKGEVRKFLDSRKAEHEPFPTR